MIQTNKWVVVVPVLNEIDNLQLLLPQLKERLPEAQRHFVDGGSQDGSRTWLLEQGEKVFESIASRGAQIHQGITKSDRSYVLVMHADSRFEEGDTDLANLMTTTLNAQGVSGGAFTFKVDHPGKKYRKKERHVAMRSRTLQMPFGDQGQFFTKSFYESCGGVGDLAIMEDVKLHDEMRKRGRIVILDEPMLTSARRFEHRGALLANVRNVAMLYLYHVGLPNYWLKKFYDWGGSGKRDWPEAPRPDLLPCEQNALATAVVIPALNEGASIGLVLNELPRDVLETVIVVDNGSSDNTVEVAKQHGAMVVHESERGYGAACLKGIESLPDNVNTVVFVDADYSDSPRDIYLLLEKICEGYDMVIGSRTQGRAQKGAILPQAAFGNALSCFLLKCFFGHRYTDLGPFRAIRRDVLEKIQMKDRAFGWTIEMQVKALIHRLYVCEVSVAYKRRVGVSKITGTVKGTFLAGITILKVIFQAGFLRKL